MRLSNLFLCLLLLSIFNMAEAQEQQNKLRIGNKIGLGIGKFQPIAPVSSADYQRLDVLGLGSIFLDAKIADSKFFIRNELGLAKLPTPTDYSVDLDASFSTQLLWQGDSDWAFGTGLRAALRLSVAGETSLFVYQRSAYEFSIPIFVEKHWSLGEASSINLGLMTTASLTRTLGDCLWWENPNTLETTLCREQLIRGGLIYIGLLYKLN